MSAPPPVNRAGVHYMEFLDAILAIHLAIIVGWWLKQGVEEMGLQLPLFVTCLFAGILLSNLRPPGLPRLAGPGVPPPWR